MAGLCISRTLTVAEIQRDTYSACTLLWRGSTEHQYYYTSPVCKLQKCLIESPCMTILIKIAVWLEIGMRDCLRNNVLLTGGVAVVASTTSALFVVTRLSEGTNR